MNSSSLTDLRNQAGEIWGNLGQSQRIAVAVVGLLSMGVIVFLLAWARTPEYATLFSNLTDGDAASIVNKLKELKTPYELANGGTAVKVPSAVLYDTRLQLASAGLPQGGGVGFELFDQSNFGMTDFVQKINYQRALEGELSRTINRLGPVEESRVHIVVPQPTLYTDNQKETTASVVLRLKPGQRLKDTQIQGIAQLLSTSVEGLKRENLSIVDSNGEILSDSLSGGNNSYKVSTSQLDAQKAFESSLEQRIQGMLDKVLGLGRSTVRVRADMSWDQVESNSETYSPGNAQPQVRSIHESVETNDGAGSSNAGGTPGSQTNIPTYAGVISGTLPAGGVYTKTDTTRNYELSKTVEKVSRAPGAVKKISVAVVLDAQQEADATPAQIDQVSKLVSAAAGLDPNRGDVLAVSSIAYNKDAFASDTRAMDEAQQWEKNLQLAKIGAMAIGPVLLLMLLLVATRRGRSVRDATSPGSVRAHQLRQLRQTWQNEIADGGVIVSIGASDTSQVDIPKLGAEDPRQRLVKDQVTTLVKSKPDAVAELIKTWMSEDKKSYGSYNFSNDIPAN